MVDQKWIDKYPHLYGVKATDPDAGYGSNECEDIVAKIVIKYLGAGGILSTWSERHCFETAVSIGYIDVASSNDIPPVPEFWIKEGHYWLTGLVMGRAARKIEEAAPTWKTYLLPFVIGNASGFSLKFLGIG